MSERRQFTDYERKTVYAKGNGKCAICGKLVKFKKMTVDHKIPLSKGGTNAFSNLQPAHRTCNLAKSEFTTEELIEFAENILKYNFMSKFKGLFTKEKSSWMN